MDWRMGKKLIFFVHIVYFIAVGLHKTTAKISTFYQLKYDLFSIYFTLNCFFASLLFESDTTTALVPYHCLVDSVEIRRAKDFHPLDNAHAEHNKTPNRHNHRLGADNNGVMTHLSISSLSSRRPRCRCRQGVRSIAGSASHPSRYRYPLRGQERRL